MCASQVTLFHRQEPGWLNETIKNVHQTYEYSLKNDESISLSHHWCGHEMYISKNIHNNLMLLFNATFTQ
jgi:hypothetical protein